MNKLQALFLGRIFYQLLALITTIFILPENGEGELDLIKEESVQTQALNVA